MADKVLDNNQVTIVGVVDSEFVYSHEVLEKVLCGGSCCAAAQQYGG